MDIIPNYQIKQQIYSANSLIYRAKQADGLDVILKIHAQSFPSASELSSYQREYDIIRCFEHDGIIKVYDLQSVQNKMLLVLEDFNGISLTQFLKNQKTALPLSLCLVIIRKIALALDVIHNEKIIHKDINPNNIIYNPHSGELKIIDFGLSTQLPRENMVLKPPSKLEGTLAYISPEQTGRMNRILDYHTDLYSLGVTCYEILTSTLPFNSDDALALIHAHIAMPATSIAEKNPAIAPIVSDIIMKLLEKNSEDRYQSAFGLAKDIQACLTRLQSTGKITPFKLARYDYTGKLHIPQKLYGRDNEIKKLLQSFKRVAQGAVEFMLVSGHSGVGKSALIHEVHKPMTEKCSYFIRGKFDQYLRNIPFYAFTRAFNEYCEYLITEPEKQLQFWRSTILKAVGNNGQILIDVIPALLHIIGGQPAVEKLAPIEGQNRFSQVMQDFISALCITDSPLVLFIDDWQWADSASLNLLVTLLKVKALRHFLVIGAYRVNEVDNAHPFARALDELSRSAAVVHTITLDNLKPADINALCAETLQTDQQTIQSLATPCYQKTQGNAFYSHQFIQTLYDQKLLQFDFTQSLWTWDIEKIAHQSMSTNVIELMVAKITRLPNEVQNRLKYAAVIGNEFDLKTLSAICNEQTKTTLNYLLQACSEQLLQPLDNNYKLVNYRSVVIHFKFLHDKIQQAAYSMIAPKQIHSIHLNLGRIMLKNNETIRDDKIFAISSHFNKALMTEVSAEERLLIMDLNLIAAKKAKQSAAFVPAANHYNRILALLPKTSWENHYKITFETFLGLAQCEYICGNFAHSKDLFDTLFLHVKTGEDKVYAASALIAKHIIEGRDYDIPIRIGLQTLNSLGLSLPTTTQGITDKAQRLSQQVNDKLMSKSLDELYAIPAMTDPQKILICRLLVDLYTLSFVTGQSDVLLLSAKSLILYSLENGYCKYSAYGYITKALFLITDGEYDKAYQFGQLAMDLNAKYPSKPILGKLCNLFGNGINSYKKSFRSGFDIHQKAIAIDIECGENAYCAWAIFFNAYSRWVSGVPLDEVSFELQRFLPQLEKINDQNVLSGYLALKSTIDKLQYESFSSSVLTCDYFDEQKAIKIWFKNNFFAAYNWYVNVKLFHHLLFAEYTEAVALADAADEYEWAHFGFYPLTLYRIHQTFALLGNYLNVNTIEQARYQKILDKTVIRIARWAKFCPQNYRHQYLLIQAEQARIQNNHWHAVECYQAAINAAMENKFTQDQALANEMAAKFYLSHNNKQAASGYLLQAHYLYQRWGAKAKVQALEKQFPEFLLQISQSTLNQSHQSNTSTENGTLIARNMDILDFDSLMKSSIAISGEITLETLLQKLMHVVIENAGAEHGVLLLVEKDDLIIQGYAAIEQSKVAVLQGFSLSSQEAEFYPLAPSIVNYVKTTKQALVLGDAMNQGRFQDDHFIQTHQCKSILCAPILHQDKLTGLFYLQNNLTTAAFTPRRLEILKFLASQAAISLENASLYANLEEKVQDRTAKLKEAHYKIVLLEKEATEKQMAGGFAHEMRNALVGAKLVVDQALGYDGEAPYESIHLKNCRNMKKIYSDLEGHLKDEKLSTILDIMKTIFANEKKLENILEVVSRSVSRGLNITQAIMKFSKVGHEAEEKKDIALDAFILQFYREKEKQLASQGIKFEVSLNAAEVSFFGQEDHFYSLISNLVNNAKDACLLTEKQKNHSIKITSHQEMNNYILNISDTGIGIPSQDISKIYNSFFSSKPETGMGLGLSVVRKILSYYDAKIEVESTINARTIFTITIPIIASKGHHDE